MNTNYPGKVLKSLEASMQQMADARQTQVTEQRERLECATQELADAYNELFDRLAPVRNSYPVRQNTVSEEAAEIVPLAAAIRQQADRIYEIRTLLRELTACIEL